MAVGTLDADDPLTDPFAIVGHQKQGRAMIAVQMIIWRHVISRVFGQQVLPLVELPIIEQRRLAVEKILDLRTRYHGWCRDSHTGAPISSFQRRQKIRK